MRHDGGGAGAQPTVSHHLKTLVDAGILTRQRRGSWAWFRLDDEHSPPCAASWPDAAQRRRSTSPLTYSAWPRCLAASSSTDTIRTPTVTGGSHRSSMTLPYAAASRPAR